MPHLPQIGGYVAETVLGEGGMATVYLAVQESLARYVALKVMNPLLSTDGDFCKRFLNEGRLVAKLSHPNIVTVHDIGAAADVHYLSMTYLPGGTLREKLREGLPLDQALMILRRLADALGYAHGHAIVHRDIKPGNVLFTESGTPVLTDFGIAKTLGKETKLTTAGMMLGSAGYMSPEQAVGIEVDNRSDLYSLGVLFWEMLTGVLPFNAQDPFSLALKHVNDPVPQLPERLRRFEPVFEGLLAKRAKDRLSSAEELIGVMDAIPGDDFAAIPLPDPEKTIAPPVNSGLETIRQTAPTRGEAATSKRPVGLLIKSILILALAGIAGTLGYLGLFRSSQEVPQVSARAPAASVDGTEFAQDPANSLQKTAEPPNEAGVDTIAESVVNAVPPSDAEPKRGSGTQRAFAQGEPRRVITALLHKAEEQWSAGRLTQPPGRNAFESYSQVLELDPEHSKAKQRLVQIGRINAANKMFEFADALLRQGKIAEARRMIETGLRMNPDDERLMGLLRALD